MRAAGLVLGVAVLLAGCGEGGPTALAANASAEAAPQEGAADAVPERKLFEGVIEAEQTRQSRIVYTIAPDKIKREVEGAGVVYDRTLKRVVLYRVTVTKRHFIKMSLDEYDEFTGGLRSLSRDEYPGIGTLFTGLDPEKYVSRNEAGATTVKDHPCDHLVISQGAVLVSTFDIDHVPGIAFDRELLRRVELNIPEEVTGFPLRVRVVDRLKKPKKQESDGKLKKFFDRATELLSDGIEFMSEEALEVLSIKPGKVDAGAFEIPEGCTELPDLEAYRDAFYTPPPKKRRSRFDWDDWD